MIARVLSGGVQLPDKETMYADIAAFYKVLEAYNLPIRYAHNQGDAMPTELGQWTYNDELTEWAGAGLAKAPQWRRELHSTLQNSIFGRPETFRDDWTDEEAKAFLNAAEMCSQLLPRHHLLHKAGRSSSVSSSGLSAATAGSLRA